MMTVMPWAGLVGETEALILTFSHPGKSVVVLIFIHIFKVFYPFTQNKCQGCGKAAVDLEQIAQPNMAEVAKTGHQCVREPSDSETNPL